MTFAQQYARNAALLSDEALLQELHSARRLAQCCTRARRDLALLRVRCLDCELTRRQRAYGDASDSSDRRDEQIRLLALQN